MLVADGGEKLLGGEGLYRSSVEPGGNDLVWQGVCRQNVLKEKAIQLALRAVCTCPDSGRIPGPETDRPHPLENTSPCSHRPFGQNLRCELSTTWARPNWE